MSTQDGRHGAGVVLRFGQGRLNHGCVVIISFIFFQETEVEVRNALSLKSRECRVRYAE